MFLALSYFGTDQSQVQRYLTGRSVAESRMGLLANGVVKVPMQFFILFIGATVFAFYQFTAPPLFFNPYELERVRQGPQATRFAEVEGHYAHAVAVRAGDARTFARARAAGDRSAIERAGEAFDRSSAQATAVRAQGIRLIEANHVKASSNDTNYVFLWFVVHHLPAGVIGLVLAAVFAASMGSVSAELNAVAATTVVDVYRRFLKKTADDRHYVRVSRLATLFWGAFAIAFAESVSRLGSLVEAVNRLGSLFYGTILGIFLAAFFLKRATGTAVFVAAIAAETLVVLCFRLTSIAFLWYNVIGCLAVLLLTVVFSEALRPHGTTAG
jgi:solute:Na+ symporter, SSS family